jgi:hypothetical protein
VYAEQYLWRGTQYSTCGGEPYSGSVTGDQQFELPSQYVTIIKRIMEIFIFYSKK